MVVSLYGAKESLDPTEACHVRRRDLITISKDTQCDRGCQNEVNVVNMLVEHTQRYDNSSCASKRYAPLLSRDAARSCPFSVAGCSNEYNKQHGKSVWIGVA